MAIAQKPRAPTGHRQSHKQLHTTAARVAYAEQVSTKFCTSFRAGQTLSTFTTKPARKERARTTRVQAFLFQSPQKHERRGRRWSSATIINQVEGRYMSWLIILFPTQQVGSQNIWCFVVVDLVGRTSFT